jgi:hypothetical protein
MDIINTILYKGEEEINKSFDFDAGTKFILGGPVVSFDRDMPADAYPDQGQIKIDIPLKLKCIYFDHDSIKFTNPDLEASIPVTFFYNGIERKGYIFGSQSLSVHKAEPVNQ